MSPNGYNLISGGQGRGKIFSEETRAKMSKARIGMKLSEKTKTKLRSVLISQKTRDKKSAAHFKPIRCVETGVIFKSIKDTAAHFKTTSSNIISVLNGTTKSARGHTFCYVQP